MERLLLTIPEAAKVTGVGKSTAYALVANGTWPMVIIGRTGKRVPVDALRAWVESNTRAAA